MRKILFRGKAIDGKWYYGDFNYFTDNCILITDNTRMSHGKKVEIDTVGLYTGLEDKNGTKIFEGDIFTWYANYTARRIYAVVSYNNGYAAWECKYEGNESSPFLIDVLKRGEVIGNIHDNPELLEVSE